MSGKRAALQLSKRDIVVIRFWTSILKALWLLSSILAIGFSSCKKDEGFTPVLSIRGGMPLESVGGERFLSVTAPKSWTLSIYYPEGGQRDWLSLSPEQGAGNTSSIVVKFSPNEKESERKAIIRIKSYGSKEAFIECVQLGKPSGPIIGKYGALRAKFSWLELPATDASDGYEYFVHKMKIGYVETRNYSYYWDFEHKVALWVAYPLNPWNIGKYMKRTDAWAYDPLMPEELQAYVGSSYGTGHTRGHQIPSADRLGIYENNAMTFYSTNMTPQSYDLNTGVWADLESQVRALSKKADTLFVVTGCVLGSNPKMIKDRMGKTIAVPEAYYKALLFYNEKSTMATYKGYCAAGVYMDHYPTPTGSPKDYTMSINELENKTGVKFFTNLSFKLDEDTIKKIKSQEPSWLSW